LTAPAPAVACPCAACGCTQTVQARTGGLCGVCGEWRAVRKDGYLTAHWLDCTATRWDAAAQAYVRTRPVATETPWRCKPCRDWCEVA